MTPRGEPDSALTVATYNIHRCIGGDGRLDPGRTADVILELDADVVALQEVDSRRTAPGALDQFETLGRLTGLEVVPGPALSDHLGHYGNAILTRLPLLERRRHDLSVRGREPRGAIDALLQGPIGSRIQLVATHLGLDRRERRAQVSELVRLLRLGPLGPDLTLLMGDMNEWRPLRHDLERLDALLGCSRRLRTFPARAPFFALDRIWVRPAEGLVELDRHDSALARRASDHLPVRAVVNVSAIARARPSARPERSAPAPRPAGCGVEVVQGTGPRAAICSR